MGNGEWGVGERGSGRAGEREKVGGRDKEAKSAFLPLSHSPALPLPFSLSSSQAIFGHTKIRVAYFGQSNLKRNFEAGL